MTIAIDSERDDQGRPRLVLTGTLDLATRGAVVNAGRGALADQSGDLVLDLGGVTFIDSTGFRALIELDRLARSAGVRTVLKSPSVRVVRLLEVIGLIEQWPIEQ